MATSLPVPALTETTCTGQGGCDTSNGSRDEGFTGQGQTWSGGAREGCSEHGTVRETGKTDPQEQPEGRTGQREGNSPGRGEKDVLTFRGGKSCHRKKATGPGRCDPLVVGGREGGTATWSQATRLWLSCRAGLGFSYPGVWNQGPRSPSDPDKSFFKASLGLNVLTCQIDTSTVAISIPQMSNRTAGMRCQHWRKKPAATPPAPPPLHG